MHTDRPGWEKTYLLQTHEKILWTNCPGYQPNVHWRGAVHHEHSERGEAKAGVVVASVNGQGHGVAEGFVHRAFHPVRTLLLKPRVGDGRAGVDTEPNPMLRAEGVVDSDAAREWLRKEDVGREVLVSAE